MAKFIVTVVREVIEYYAVKADTVQDAEEIDVNYLRCANPLRSEECDCFVQEAVPVSKAEIREEIRAGGNEYTYIGLAEAGSDLSEVYLDIR